MIDVSRMKEGACRLFTCLVVHGCDHSTPELMRLAGISNRNVFFSSLHDLEAAGLVEIGRISGKRSAINLVSLPSYGGRGSVVGGCVDVMLVNNNISSLYNTTNIHNIDTDAKPSVPLAPAQPPSAPTTIPTLNTVELRPVPVSDTSTSDRYYSPVPLTDTSTSKRYGSLVPVSDTSTSEWYGSDEEIEVDTLDLIVEADQMDESGKISDRNSPAQIRRQKQIQLLMRAWAEILPNANPLVESAAKDLLRQAGNIAEVIYEAMQVTRENEKKQAIGSYLNYVGGVMKKLKQSAPVTSHGQVNAEDRERYAEYERKQAIIDAMPEEEPRWKKFKPVAK